MVILGQILALGYYRALVIAKRDSEFSQLLRICLLNIAILGGVTGLLSIFFGDAIIYYFKMPNLGAWIYTLAPLSILFALDQIMVQWGIRNKAFKQSTTVEIPLNLGTKLFNVGYGNSFLQEFPD